MNAIIHDNAVGAIRQASHDGTGRDAVAYIKSKGWIAYDLRNGCPQGGEPEFIFCRPGALPFPVSETAIDVLASILREKLS